VEATINGDAFVFIDRDTARVTTIPGYPPDVSLNWADLKLQISSARINITSSAT
jgi:hypothetical protein